MTPQLIETTLRRRARIKTKEDLLCYIIILVVLVVVTVVLDKLFPDMPKKTKQTITTVITLVVGIGAMFLIQPSSNT